MRSLSRSQRRIEGVKGEGEGESLTMTGVVYLLHFLVDEEQGRKLGVARHYVGFTTDVVGRMRAHRAGRGARLTKVLRAVGGDFVVVRLWPGDQTLEKKLKKRGPKTVCPMCANSSSQRRIEGVKSEGRGKV